MENWPRQVPQAERCRRIDRMLIPGERAEADAEGRRGIQTNHGASQSRPPTPRTRKKGRQPKAPTIVPPTRMPIAEPRERPAITSALGKPRRASGKRALRMFE